MSQNRKRGATRFVLQKSSTIHTLGLSQDAEEGAKKKSQQYIARGAPMEEIQQLLESLSWTEVADLHKVKYKPVGD
jgi:hypothetical protein